MVYNQIISHLIPEKHISIPVPIPVTSVPFRVRNLRKMRNFWEKSIDFEPEINLIKCKTEILKQKT